MEHSPRANVLASYALHTSSATGPQSNGTCTYEVSTASEASHLRSLEHAIDEARTDMNDILTALKDAATKVSKVQLHSSEAQSRERAARGETQVVMAPAARGDEDGELVLDGDDE